MLRADLGYVVAEHLNHFPAGFFARLGTVFLTRYYRTYLDSDHAHAIVATRAGEIAGFLVGTTRPTAHRRWMIRHHGRTLLLAGTRALLNRPRLAVSFARTRGVRYARRLVQAVRPAKPQPDAAGNATAALTHLAVCASAQGLGVGAALVGAFVGQARAAGCAAVVLVTRADESGAGAFYERRGWSRRSTHLTPDGVQLATYGLTLTSSHAGHPGESGNPRSP